MHNECELLQEPDTEQYVSALVQRILNHIGEPAEPPRISPARGPPAWDDPPVEAVPDWDALAQPQPEYVFDQQVQW
jgi:hypothetical protein